MESKEVLRNTKQMVFWEASQRYFLRMSEKIEKVALYIDNTEPINSMKFAKNILKENVISRLSLL